jgi:acyl carrier protein
MNAHPSTLNEVKSLIAETLGIQDRARVLDASTPLFGSMPELDSLAVVELAAALEERFGFEIGEGELTAETFETIGTLAAFVERNRR